MAALYDFLLCRADFKLCRSHGISAIVGCFPAGRSVAHAHVAIAIAVGEVQRPEIWTHLDVGGDHVEVETLLLGHFDRITQSSRASL